MTSASVPKRPLTIVIAPNSYKGSLTSTEVAAAMQAGINRVWSDAKCVLLPMADGGEGTLAVVTNARDGVIRKTDIALGPAPQKQSVLAQYGLLPDGTGVIEVANLVGFQQRAQAVEQRTTFAVGRLLQHCLDLGIRRFLIGLGGSGTNDAGAGMLFALGARYRDAQGKLVDATPASLKSIAKIDFSELDPRLSASHITVMADVNNILCGKAGATYVFGSQKGIAHAALATIDANIAHFASLADSWARGAVSQAPGSGAAGGLGYALQLMGGKHASGAEIVAALIKLDENLKAADWVLTGEGKSDLQTLSGKAPFVVARHAKKYNVPVMLISGAIEAAAAPELRLHFNGCFSLLELSVSKEKAITHAALLIADRIEQIARSHNNKLG